MKGAGAAAASARACGGNVGVGLRGTRARQRWPDFGRCPWIAPPRHVACAVPAGICSTTVFAPHAMRALALQATIRDVKAKLYDNKARRGKYHPCRQRLTVPAAEGKASGQALEDGKALQDYGLSGGGRIVYKDLGMQARSCMRPGRPVRLLFPASVAVVWTVRPCQCACACTAPIPKGV